jgi:thioester reductase-like protein
MEEIAIVGVSGRFPGAPDLDSFWENLRGGRESVHFYSDDELAAMGIDGPHLRKFGFVAAKPRLEGAELFDAEFFGYSLEEAEIIEPQQRIFLEVCWEALESAGRNPQRLEAPTGVFAGQGAAANYLIFNLGPAGRLEPMHYYATVVANGPDFLTGRVAFKLDLKGPSVTIQAACTTSLAAVHLACQSLLNFECDFALAGGVSLQTLPLPGHFPDAGGSLSPDGHTRVFDAKARGMLSGEGAGAVVLRRLEDAVADGDTIHAVIRGTALNNSGHVPAGFMTPDVKAQEDVVAEAIANAGVAADSISYVEAHGTGSPIGDCIEVAALGRAFRRTTARTDFCGLGAVKSNIGHLGPAAGIASLIKTVLAMRHREIPPTILVERVNPGVPLAGSPFHLVRALEPWTSPRPLRACVHAYGIGGGNAHVVLEEPPATPAREATGEAYLLVLSARSPSALAAAARRLAERLRRDGDLALDDVSFTLARGREDFRHRLFVVCRDLAEGAARLTDLSGPLCGRGEADPSSEPPAKPQAATPEALAALGTRWLAGVRIDWASVFQDRRPRRVPLPTYPFERRRCWVEAVKTEASRPVTAPPPVIRGTPTREGARVAARSDLEARLVALWREATGASDVGIDDNFFELGGTSLTLAEIHGRLRREVTPDVTVVDVFGQPTVRGLAARLVTVMAGAGVRPATTGFDAGSARLTDEEMAALRSEARLAADVRPSGAWKALTDAQDVLLTGATGFLGTFLLKELIRRTSARVHCLVRAADSAAGRARIEKALAAHLLWDDADAARIVPVCGDLGEPLMGLSEETFTALAGQIDAVYHNGALVDFTYPYAKLRAANVEGTEAALRLACTSRTKAFHLVSSVAVWAGRFPVAEEDPLEDIAGLENGYAQSKWVAERLVHEAAGRGLPVCVYRPPRVVGDTRRGVTNLDDFVARVIKGCAQLGLAPTGHFFDVMSPVDYVAAAIVALSRDPRAYQRRVFHLARPRLMSWRTILDYMVDAGVPLRMVPYDEWRSALVERCQTEDNALRPLLPLFRPQSEDARAQPPPEVVIDWDQLPTVACAHTEELLAGTGIACPELGRGLLDAHFEYFFQSGHLARPTVSART